MKLLALLLLAIVCSGSARAGTPLALPAPVDCAHYVGGGGTAVAVDILSLDEATGIVRFHLLDAAGVALGGGAVFGLTLAGPTLDAVPAAVAAEIASKG